MVVCSNQTGDGIYSMCKFVDYQRNEELTGKLVVEPTGWLRIVLDETETEYRVAEMRLDKHGCFWIKAMDCHNNAFNCRETPYKTFLYFAD